MAGLRKAKTAARLLFQPGGVSTILDHLATAVRAKNHSSTVDLRDEFIKRVAPSHSFADVGGLWGTIGEKISVAAKAGATSLTMIDVREPQAELWTKFRDRLAGFGLTECQCISGDICEFGFQPNAPVYDVVHCAGVLYHHPSPLRIIEALRRITRKYLILTSVVIQETIKTRLGKYIVPPSGVVFVPALNEHDRQILANYWTEQAGLQVCYGITEPVNWNTSDFDPWWFLPTATAMKAMATCCRFRVIESVPIWNKNAHTVLLETRN